MPLTYALEEMRPVCMESVEAFVTSARSLSEIELLDASRCLGWSRHDVVTHVVAGW